jgi:lipopolysaccharide transport system ATP-binding protein
MLPGAVPSGPPDGAVIACTGIGKAYQIYSNYNGRMWQVLFGRGRQHPKAFWVLRGIDLRVGRGECLGVIGRNGAGKTTLLQMICGITAPTEGHLHAAGRIAPVLALGAGFDHELTGRENARIGGTILGLKRAEVGRRIDSIAEFAGLGSFFDQPVKFYSSGMVSRLAFAVCVHVDADILIVDEALSVGDDPFQQRCSDFINSFRRRGTLLFVSHDMQEIVRLCTRAMWIDRGTVRASGDPKAVTKQYQDALKVEKDDPERFNIRA